MMIKGILFDKDGTLIEFMNVWHEIIGNILKALETEYHFSGKTVEVIKEVSGYLKNSFTNESIIQYYATSEIVKTWQRVLSEEAAAEGTITYQELMNLFNKKAMDEHIEINAVDGARELLNYLKERNYILGVATADTLASATFSLNKAGILPYFDYIGCNEEGTAPKPAADLAVRFCEEKHLRPEEVLIVGDSVTDMLFAENAGTGFAGINTAYNDHKKFSEHGKLSVDRIYDIIAEFDL